MIEHLAASGHEVDGVLADRSLSNEATRKADRGLSARSSDIGAGGRAGARFGAHDRYACPTPCPRRWVTFIRRQLARTGSSAAARRAALRPDLRALLVGRAVRRARRDVPKILDFGDMDSQKWLEYAQHKPFPLSLGYRLEGTKLTRGKAARARFDSVPPRRAPNGRRSKATAPARRPTGFRTVSTASTSRRRTSL